MSNPAPHGTGPNKAALLFLVASLIMLLAAGIFYFKKRSTPAAPPAPPPEPVLIAAPPPLVEAEPTRPLAEVEDAAPTVAEKRPASRTEKAHLGTIDPKVVNAFMNARFGMVKTCYERRLKNNAFLEGKLDLNIEISPTGTVTSVHPNRDTLRDRELYDCVERTIKAWQFPAPQGGPVVIAKTFNFKKSGS